jgi:tyrosyl-tRNA synthetase
LQMGGSDQWGNILAGVDLTRRLEGKIIHGLTFPLITTADGQKMGKTHKGAIWLDSGLTSPYEYYQYWVNTDNRDVKRFFHNFTFLPLGEIEELSGLRGEDLQRAKEVLAYETTKICHGQDAADKARRAARQLFREKVIEDIEEIPTYSMTLEELGDGIEAYILFQNADLCATRSEARRLISQGGAYLNGKRIPSFETKIGPDDIQNDTIVLRVGKKKYLKVHFQDL